MEKVFILGLGAQKGGTTWLHDYIKTNHDADFGFLKEYHIFDALHIPACRNYYNTRRRQARRYAVNINYSFKEHKGLWKRVAFLSDQTMYYDYFANLLDSEKIGITGDITPSYCGLPEKVLARIHKNFNKRGVIVKPVFLMRDPLERCWSAVRMRRRNTLNKNPETVFDKTEEEELLRHYTDPNCVVRTRYDETIKNILGVFEERNVYFGFYETLFTEDEIRRLCAFLGREYNPADFLRSTNSTEKNSSISEEVASEIVDYYRETYVYLCNKYGVSFINRIWPSSRLL